MAWITIVIADSNMHFYVDIGGIVDGYCLNMHFHVDIGGIVDGYCLNTLFIMKEASVFSAGVKRLTYTLYCNGWNVKTCMNHSNL